MAEPQTGYVLDSFAMLAYLQAEPGGISVLGLLDSARNQIVQLFLSQINLGETYYMMRRRKGVEHAEEMLSGVQRMPITLFSATDERVFAAARLKAEHSISYADAFAGSLAEELGATLVTGDPEFKDLEPRISILWLPKK